MEAQDKQSVLDRLDKLEAEQAKARAEQAKANWEIAMLNVRVTGICRKLGVYLGQAGEFFARVAEERQ
jgi:hypothetical protein